MSHSPILPPTLILQSEITMKKSKMKNKNNRLTGTAVLRDKFVPQHLKAINLAPVATRWVLCNGSFNADGSPNDMEPVIAKMAENFIPRVPCMCGETPEPIHGPYYYLPSPVHRVPPGRWKYVCHFVIYLFLVCRTHERNNILQIFNLPWGTMPMKNTILPRRTSMRQPRSKNILLLFEVPSVQRMKNEWGCTRSIRCWDGHWDDWMQGKQLYTSGVFVMHAHRYK